MTMSTIVPMEGASLEWVARRVLALVKEIGLEGAPMVAKTDQEPAIFSLVGEISKRRSAKTFPEHSPGASSQSNGYIERAIQSVSGQIRVMLEALEASGTASPNNLCERDGMARRVRLGALEQIRSERRREDLLRKDERQKIPHGGP